VAPEEEDTSRSTDLIVGKNVTKFLWNIANALDDGIKTLTRVNDD
jgi:hypothetical protein